jgi:hypothetical protein
METHVSTVPSWLASSTSEQSPQPSQLTAVALHPRTPQEITYKELTFENFFERALDRFSLGHQLSDIVSDDPREIDAVQFMRWIKKDKQRHNRYLEALEISAEILLPTLLPTAQGRDSMNDVKRDGLIVDTTLKYMALANPKRFGKEQGVAAGAGGGGGITINIGEVVSPYVKDVTPAPSGSLVEITDVEVK